MRLFLRSLHLPTHYDCLEAKRADTSISKEHSGATKLNATCVEFKAQVDEPSDNKCGFVLSVASSLLPIDLYLVSH